MPLCEKQMRSDHRSALHSFFGVIRGYRFFLSLRFFAALADIFMPLYEKCFIRWTTPFVVRLALGENFELAHHDFGYKYLNSAGGVVHRSSFY